MKARNKGPVEGEAARRDARIPLHLAAPARVSLGAQALDAAAALRRRRETRPAVQTGAATKQYVCCKRIFRSINFRSEFCLIE